MTATIIAIIAVVIAAIPIYFLARTNAREAQRQRNEATGKAISEATMPLNTEISELRLRIRDLSAQLMDRQRRVETLEDELRRRG